MKKACPYCGKICGRDHDCPKKPHFVRSRSSREDSFRSSYSWQEMRRVIMERDKYLCRACLDLLPGTVRRLNNEELSVHHIRPLRTNWEYRLDCGNLITLCRTHHEMAEKGEISAKKLLKIIKNIPPEG